MIKQNVLCVAGVKAGIGKSTIAKELAMHISKNTRTCLIDLDLLHGIQKMLFKILPSQSVLDWQKDFKDASTMSPAESESYYDWDKIQEFLTVVPNTNLYILPAFTEFTNYDTKTTLADREISCLLHYLKNHFDCIIIDTASNLEDYTKAAINSANTVLLLVTDDLTCINRASLFNRQIQDNHWLEQKFYLIVNHYLEGAYCLHTLPEIKELLQHEVFAVIPHDDEVSFLNKSGLSLLESGSPNSGLMRKGLLQLFQSVDSIF